MGCLRFRGQAKAMDVGQLIQDQSWMIKNQGKFQSFMEAGRVTDIDIANQQRHHDHRQNWTGVFVLKTVFRCLHALVVGTLPESG